MTPSERLRLALAEHPTINTVAAVRRRAKLAESTATSYFRGDRDPPLDVCNDIGKVLGVHGQWLFDGTRPKAVTEEPRPSDEQDVQYVPLIDYVTAGRLTRPSSQIPVEDVPLFAFADLGPGEFFALQVSGTSMDRLSPNGSIIIVNRRDTTLISGRCYVFAADGETTYKRWQGGDPPYLEPYSTDPSHKPHFIRKKRDFEVVGRVKRTVLDL